MKYSGLAACFADDRKVPLSTTRKLEACPTFIPPQTPLLRIESHKMNPSSGCNACLLAITLVGLAIVARCSSAQIPDPIAKLQVDAVATRQADWGHWGPTANTYSSWKTHSNRLIPVYTFEIDLQSVSGENSLYRDPAATKMLYGYLPDKTLNSAAEYFDQTDNYRLQKSAVESDDVDWANHSNNIDNSIGAVLSGDDAFEAVVKWIERNGGWDETALVLTAGHCHYFNLVRPEALIQKPAQQ